MSSWFYIPIIHSPLYIFYILIISPHLLNWLIKIHKLPIVSPFRISSYTMIYWFIFQFWDFVKNIRVYPWLNWLPWFWHQLNSMSCSVTHISLGQLDNLTVRSNARGALPAAAVASPSRSEKDESSKMAPSSSIDEWWDIYPLVN